MSEKSPVAAAPQPVKGASFGERMRRERELRGVKLEEIAESTKIGKRNLVALEEEAFDQLPGGIFNKGFVRAYAKFLGLDEEQAVNDFLAASANYDQPAALAPLASMVKPAVMPSDEAVRKKDLRWAIAALIILILVLGAWLYTGRVGLRKRATVSGDAEVSLSSEAKPKTVAPEAVAQSAPASANASSVTSAPAAETKPSEKAESSDKGAITSAQAADQSKAANTSTAKSSPQSISPAPPTSAPSSLILSVHATGDSWVSVTGDGAPMGQFDMRAGETRRFQAEKSLTLKAGNAGAVELSLNGKPQPKLGKDKEVKTATFTASDGR